MVGGAVGELEAGSREQGAGSKKRILVGSPLLALPTILKTVQVLLPPIEAILNRIFGVVGQ